MGTILSPLPLHVMLGMLVLVMAHVPLHATSKVVQENTHATSIPPFSNISSFDFRFNIEINILTDMN